MLKGLLGPGLYFVDNWMGPNSIFPGYAAAGAQLTIFQYGGGAAARTVLDPSPAVTSPLLWTSANPIDLCCSQRKSGLLFRNSH